MDPNTIMRGRAIAPAGGVFRRRSWRLEGAVVLVAASLSLAGCGAIYRARQAQKEKNLTPGERTVTAAEVGLSAGSTLTLDRAIEIGLQYQPAMVAARQNLVIAQKQTRIAFSAYVPGIQAQAAYRQATTNVEASKSATALPPGVPAPETPKPSNDTTESYSAGINAQQLLFDFGRTAAAVRSAKAHERAAEAQLRATESAAAFQVKSAYYQLAKGEALARVAEDSVQQFEEHLERVELLVEVGRRIEYDATKARVDLGNAQLNLISAQNLVSTSRAALNQAMGLAEEPGYAIGDPPAAESLATAEELMALARENRPELQLAQAEEKAASLDVSAAVANLFPSLTLSAGYTWTGSDFPLVWNWFVSPAAVLDLLAIPRKTGQIDQAVARLRIARSRRAAEEQQAYLELSQAVAARENARQRLELTALVVEQAQQNLELAAERYQVGRASAIEETDARVALSRALSDQVGARFDYLTAVARIQRALGER